jgi:hypothetical protein
MLVLSQPLGVRQSLAGSQIVGKSQLMHGFPLRNALDRHCMLQ